VDRSASESLRLVQQAGVAVAEWRRADSVAAAEAAADALGGPVVVKADLPASTHKRRAGGVRLGVHRQDVAVAAKELLDLAPAVLVARELRGGPELFVGVRRDPTFGLVVVAGLGGGHMELLDRTVLAPADAPAAWFTERLHRRLLHRAGDDGWRLAEALAATGERLVDVAQRTGADLVECNPLIERDGGLVALDARVV
jgi:succinyl-CoA synthetase beta subunit